MDLAVLFAQTIENHGATITRTGERLARGDGFLVSRAGYETKIDGALSFASFVTLLLEYQTTINESVDLAGCVVGFWYDTESRSWYVDISERIFDRGIAERLGRHRNQIAIFDLSKGEAITIK
jgi:hypothetical protein